MSWKRLVYMPDPIKTHFVHESIVDDVVADILNNHGYEPREISDADDFRLDPGGIMMMDSEPLTKSFEGAIVSIKPEHIWGATTLWSEYNRVVAEDDAGPSIRKVYGAYTCVCIPEKIYQAVGAWLVSLNAVGVAARQEVADRLSGSPHVHVAVPKAIGDA